MILFDTNILVAAARTADVNHHIAVRLLNTMSEPRLVPPTVVAEVCYLLSEWGGPDLLPRHQQRPTTDRAADVHPGVLIAGLNLPPTRARNEDGHEGPLCGSL